MHHQLIMPVWKNQERKKRFSVFRVFWLLASIHTHIDEESGRDEDTQYTLTHWRCVCMLLLLLLLHSTIGGQEPRRKLHHTRTCWYIYFPPRLFFSFSRFFFFFFFFSFLVATCVRFCEQLHFRKVLTPPWFLFSLEFSPLAPHYIDTGTGLLFVFFCLLLYVSIL